jgi:hypothetical protein
VVGSQHSVLKLDWEVRWRESLVLPSESEEKGQTGFGSLLSIHATLIDYLGTDCN